MSRRTLLEKVHFFTEDVHIELDENAHLIFQPYIPISFAAAAAAVCVSIIWAKIAQQTKNSFSQHGASFPNSFQKSFTERYRHKKNELLSCKTQRYGCNEAVGLNLTQLPFSRFLSNAI